MAAETSAYPLRLGLPHTNLNGLAEPQLLMYAGYFQWASLASALGRPLSELRTRAGNPVYATFYYVEIDMPASRPLDGYNLDHDLIFVNHLRHFKGTSIDGTTVFDRAELVTPEVRARVPEAASALRGSIPFVRLANVFVERGGGNESLKTCPPEGCSFEKMAPLPMEESAYPLTREASRTQSFGLLDPSWQRLDRRQDFVFDYPIDPERDTNGAGLVYFAQYAAFLNRAERAALEDNSALELPAWKIGRRTMVRRKLAYYGNAALEDTLRIGVEHYAGPDALIGVRCRIHRGRDGRLIALSEAVKRLPSGNAGQF